MLKIYLRKNEEIEGEGEMCPLFIWKRTGEKILRYNDEILMKLKNLNVFDELVHRRFAPVFYFDFFSQFVYEKLRF